MQRSPSQCPSRSSSPPSSNQKLAHIGLNLPTVCNQKRDQTHGTSCIMASSMSSSPISGSFPMIGDCIGMESCFDVVAEDHHQHSAAPAANQRPTEITVVRRRCSTPRREFPPPIPLLARTGNLSSHMPWILRRDYVDGRLILREEKVKHHEYFQAHRSNGRLILQLVALDDDLLNLPPFNAASVTDEGSPEDGVSDQLLDGIHSGDDERGPDDDSLHVDDGRGDHGVYSGDDQGPVADEGDGTAGDFLEGENKGDNAEDRRSMAASSSSSSSSSSSLSPVKESSGIGGGSSSSTPGKCLDNPFVGIQVPEIRPVIS